MTATTALTAQDTTGVHDIHHVPQEFLLKQIDACIGDIGVDVVKTGEIGVTLECSWPMGFKQLTRNQACWPRLLRLRRLLKLSRGARSPRLSWTRYECCFPLRTEFRVSHKLLQVMIATSGAELLPREAVAALLEGLLKLTTVLTPNIPEAKLILEDSGHASVEIESVGDLEAMARSVQALGPEWVLVKGGHAPLKADLTVAKSDEDKAVVVDVLYGHGEFWHVESPYQSSTNTHGTGCSLACELRDSVRG